MRRRQSVGDVISVELVNVQLDGIPSCVHSADIEISYRDGTVDLIHVSYAPNGVMYEVLEDELRAVWRLLHE